MLGKHTKVGNHYPEGPCVAGTTKYKYYQVYKGDKLIDCLRTVDITRRMYGKKIQVRD